MRAAGSQREQTARSGYKYLPHPFIRRFLFRASNEHHSGEQLTEFCEMRAAGSQREQTARSDLPPCCTFPINPSPGWATRKFSAITASDFGVAWKWDPVQHRADPENLDPPDTR
ncbi:hypothetical protein NDU88_006243 [Pleurodeles waltl]|uniref:Uncharacterized protein n=1 Tax=Pleurodeles waltl TaxID=8319 RepID=A0AAV7RQN8_PLEWA|nr:hypothetical protein NDU88_006243 [Pleurodeles waltl]